MFDRIRAEENIWIWRWPIITVVVLGSLFAIQLLRVNRPEAPPVAQPRTYSTPGPLIAGDVVVPAAGFHLIRIDLNRRARMSGKFWTGNVASRINVLVIPEAEFENWQQHLDYKSLAQTGHVPGGKVAPVLDVGPYLLILDNRQSDVARSVQAEFVLE